MIRRRLIIEWDDEGTDTDEECPIQDLLQLDKEPSTVNLNVWVEDAPQR